MIRTTILLSTVVLVGCTGRSFSDCADAGAGTDLSTAVDLGPPDLGRPGMLGMLRLEMPCGAPNGNPALCGSTGAGTASTVLMGEPGAQYDVTLRFRGVVEEKTIVGGMPDGQWNVGGTPATDTFNLYSFVVSDPPLSAYLNMGVEAYSDPMDFTEVVRIATGATVTINAVSSDMVQARNLSTLVMPIVIPGIPPAPAAYNGQFVQADVVSITRVR